MQSLLWRACALFCFATAIPLLAEAPVKGLELETAPASLEIESCEAGAPLLVIARNPSGEAAPRVAIAVFSDASLTVEPAPLPQAVGAHRETSWQFQVKCLSGFNGGNLQVVMRSAADSKPDAPANRILTHSVAVKLRSPLSLDSIAAIDVKSTLETLRDGENGELLVTVTNRIAQPVSIAITPSGPSFIQFDPVSATQSVTALGSSVIPFTVKAGGRVIPGKQLLLFKVDLTAGGVRRTYLASREVDVGILGESEILKVLGVPSLFLLPGFLAVSAFLLLWKWKVWRAGPSDNPPLEEGKTGFWVVSITASLLITGCFLLQRHDFFAYYGLADLMIVWFVSLFVGAAVYIAWRGVAYAIQRTFPQPEDDPIEILRKMKNRRKPMNLPLVTVKGASQPLFLLLSGLGSAYVCPSMNLTWKDDANDTIRANVQDQLTAGGDPGIIRDNLLTGFAGVHRFKWDESDPLHSYAHRIEADDILDAKAGTDIVLKEQN